MDELGFVGWRTGWQKVNVRRQDDGERRRKWKWGLAEMWMIGEDGDKSRGRRKWWAHRR